MLANLLVWLLVAVLAAFFVWLAARAWHSRRGMVRWPGAILGSLAALLFLSLFIIGGIGMYKSYVPVRTPAEELQISANPELIARGEHFAEIFCIDCHSPNGEMPMVGGVDMARDLALPVGAMVSTNLTPAGPLKDYTDGELMRLLREGIGQDGLPRSAMSTINVRFMSDDDLKALIAYLRSLDPVENNTPLPADQPNFLGILVAGAGLVPQLPEVTAPITAPEKAASVEYGEYLLSFHDCRVCHGANLGGGTSQLTPNGPSLLTVQHMSEEQFLSMMRTGKRPDGYVLQPPMPVRTIARMDDTELSAMYRYLSTLPGRGG